jgi:signal transduction histidine kinase/ligand-binding sensor domain-containing protein
MKNALPAVLLLISMVAFSQPDFRFHNYGLSEGLPSPAVRDISEDTYGFIWFATSEGLSRFNGYNFKTFRNVNGSQPELTSNDITNLYPLQNGDLLVGTTTGLHIFDHKKLLFKNTWGTLPQSYISKIVSDGKTGFWVSSSTGLYHLMTVGAVPDVYIKNENSPLFNTGIFDVHLDNKNNLWITTSRKGFFKLSLDSDKLINYRNNPADPASLSSDALRQLAALDDGRLIIGTAEFGYNVFDPATEKFTRYNHNPSDPTSLSGTSAFAMLIDSKKNLWIGTWADGLNAIDSKTWTGRNFKNNPDKKYSVCSNSIVTLFEASTGDIWIGSSQGGASRLTPAEQKFFRYSRDADNENSMTTPFVRSIYEDNEGIIWFGTNQGGLNRFDPAKNSYNVFLKPDGSRESLSRGTIWSMSAGENGTIWLGTSRGVGKLNAKTGAITFIESDAIDSRKLSSNNVLKVLDDQHGSLWVATYRGGLNRVDIKTGLIEKFMHDEKDVTSISGNNVNDVFIDSKNRIWVGCEQGLNLFDKNEKSFKHFLKSNEATSIFHINEGADGNIYVAASYGLVILDPDTGNSIIISETEGLSAGQANSVLVDANGFVWIGTNNGIDRFDPKAGEMLHLDESQGLCANDTDAKSCFKSKAGIFYFGGTNGATAFDPLTVFTDYKIPHVTFSNLSILNKVVAVSDTTILTQSIYTIGNIKLQYSDYIFAFEFAALKYNLPDKIKYAYKLEGFDKNWIYADASDRKAVYTNVPPGSYTLKVKASNAYGKFSDEFTAMPLVIVPPWWKTWWAQTLFYGVALAFGFALVRARFAFIKRQNKLLEQQVAERTTQIIQQKEEIQIQAEALDIANRQKTKLFSIIAHDLKSPLNSLKGLLTLFDPKILSSEDLEMMKEEINERVDGVSSVMENLLGWASGQLEGEILHFEKVDPSHVIQEMIELYTPIAEKKEIILTVNTNHASTVEVDINLLRAVMRNLTSNAIKFTPTGGTVSLSTKEENNELITMVKDSGVGMSNEEVKNLFSNNRKSTSGTGGERGVGLGLRVVNDFVRKLNGRVWVESREGEGTTFFFAFKIATGY